MSSASIRASRIVHDSLRHALYRPVSVRCNRRSVRLNLLGVLLNSPPLVPRSPRAVPALSSRLLPAYAGTGTAITLPRTSYSWLARRCSGYALEL